MRKDVTLAAEARDLRGKNAARRLRALGSVPAIVYGGEGGPAAVALNPKELTKILHSKTGHNTIFNLSMGSDANTPVMIVDWQFDPIKDTLLHADLKRIDLQKRILVKIPVVTQGDPRGVKLQGGLYEIVTREIEIECLPDDIPEQFTVDVTELTIGQTVRASDIPLSGSMRLTSLPDAVISHVVSLRAEDSTTAATGGSTGEPEVTKKGKKEAEGGGDSGGKKK